MGAMITGMISDVTTTGMISGMMTGGMIFGTIFTAKRNVL